jgi:hypothetical protein
MLRVIKAGFGAFRQAVRTRTDQKIPADWHSKIGAEALLKTLPKDYGPAYWEKLSVPKGRYFDEPELFVMAIQTLAEEGEAKDIYQFEEYDDKFEMGKGTKRELKYKSPIMVHKFNKYTADGLLSIMTKGLMATIGNLSVHDEQKAVRAHHLSPHEADGIFAKLPEMGDMFFITKFKSEATRNLTNSGIPWYQAQLPGGYLMPELWIVRHKNGSFHMGGSLFTAKLQKLMEEEQKKIKEEKQKKAVKG